MRFERPLTVLNAYEPVLLRIQRLTNKNTGETFHVPRLSPEKRHRGFSNIHILFTLILTPLSCIVRSVTQMDQFLTHVKDFVSPSSHRIQTIGKGFFDLELK